MPVGLILSPIILGCDIATACVGEHTAAPVFLLCVAGLPSVLSIFLSSLIKSGVVPQHPPNTFIPYGSRIFIDSAKSAADRLYLLVLGSGSPALGLRTIGRLVQSASSFTTGSSSFGPREQLTPIASTPSPSRVNAIDCTDTPVNVLWFISNVIVTMTGRSEFSFAASTPALTSSRSVIVSNTMRSASLPAFISCAYIS